MALRETALSIVIRARDLSSNVLGRFRRAINGTGEASDTAGQQVEKLTRRVIALAGTYLGINALKKAIGGIIGTGARFEQLETQINSMMGSIEAGEAATAWIKDFASKTPTDLAGVTEGFIKLKALGIDPMNGSYQAIIDQTSKLGFTQEKMEGVILAVGQAWTKQKLQQEEANQLIERGVPVWDLLAKATGKNTAELQKLSSAGKLGRKEIKLFIDEMGRSSQGAAAEQMRTWNGLVSNIKDSWTNFVGQIADAGIFDFAKDQLQELTVLAAKMAADGRLKEYAQQISDYLVKVATRTKDFVNDAVANFDLIVSGAEKTVAGFSLIFNGFTAGVKTIGGSVSSAISVILSSLASGLEAAQLDDAAANLRIKAGAMAAVSDAFKKELEQDSKDIKAAWDTLNGQSFSDAEQAVTALATISETTKTKIVSNFESIANSATSSSEQIRNAFIDGINTESDVTALAARFSELGAEGRVSADHIVQGLDLVSGALDNITEKAESAKSAVNGITTSTQGIKDHLAALDEAAKSQEKKATATKKDTGAVENNTAATDKNTESVRANRGAALSLAGKTGAAWDAASEQMGAAYDRLADGMANAVNKFGSLPRAAFSYVKDFADAYWRAEEAAVSLQKSYDQQQTSLERHLSSLTDADAVTEEMVEKAEQAVNSFDLLGDQQLAPLRSAISAIKSDMDSLTDSLESTVDGLRDELDRLNGDAVAIEERAYQRKREALQEQSDLAYKQNNSDASSEARTALRLLEQTYQIKRNKAQAQQAAEQQAATHTPAPSSKTTPNKTVRVEFQNATGGTYTGDFDNDGATQLLAQLEGARFVSS
ncbi:tape measure protein [Neptunomonas sp.]|uniref:tape measure protein n=1 Tax=Neptunomonas sp. TaxID=1971898 RepID=UPI0025D515CD|nr:tape measure protein [Neptunomonas sp.]